jgi:hypothetical protein
MIVTLDIFSGRPNPSWTLAAKDAQNLIGRLAGRAMAAIDAVDAKLGYRGFIISAGSDDTAVNARLPDAFRIGGSVPEELVTPAGLALPALTNGFWGHKPGPTPACNTDNQGRVIGGNLDPQNCDRGPYTVFCGYRFSPVGMRVQ